MKISKDEAIKILSRYDNEYYTPATRQAHRMGMEALKCQWIPVTERLPEQYVSVLVYIPSDAQLPTVKEAYLVDGYWMTRMYAYREKEITHWMPMPDGPKEVER